MSSQLLIDMDDGLYTFQELSDKYGISVKVLQTRYYRGDRGEHLVRKVLSTSANGRKNSMKSNWRRDWMKGIA